MQRPPPGRCPKKKSGLHRQAEPDLFPTTDTNTDSTPIAHFSGTDNPRHLRVLHALMTRPRRREEVDRIAGASNGPDLIFELRKRGLSVQCRRVPGIDCDGKPVKFGVYFLDDTDRRAIAAWQRRKELKGCA